MEFLPKFFDLFIHLDHHINSVVEQFGVWTYAIVFLIIFCETGLVFTPFLPGDSLLFVLGALAAIGSLQLWPLVGVLILAAILGDTVNFWIGNLLAPKIFSGQRIRFLKREHLERTHQFFEKYGGKTIIIARFVPIVRTFAPFLAGVGSMTYGKFLTYNVVGGILWVGVVVAAGYFFGNLEFVRKNFSLVVLGIIFVSLLPGVIEYIKHKNSSRKGEIK